MMREAASANDPKNSYTTMTQRMHEKRKALSNSATAPTPDSRATEEEKDKTNARRRRLLKQVGEDESAAIPQKDPEVIMETSNEGVSAGHEGGSGGLKENVGASANSIGSNAGIAGLHVDAGRKTNPFAKKGTDAGKGKTSIFDELKMGSLKRKAEAPAGEPQKRKQTKLK